MTREKRYDAAYFQRWYRQAGRGEPAHLGRKVALAVAMAEYYLERPLRSVLDVGCGEGRWRAVLRRLRPDISYLGFDASPYAVGRFGARRQLRLARFGDFAHLRPCAPADLLVCSDVIHYLDLRELDRGLPGLASLCGGVAFLETFAAGDPVEGDTVGFKRRLARVYRERFARAGFTPLGTHLYLSPALAGRQTALERP